MNTHDPKQVIEDVRDHLASHDRRLAFLFGAGASCAINIAPPAAAGARRGYKPLIPGIVDLTKACAGEVAKMGKPQEAAWKTIVEQCNKDNVLPNVENILSKVRIKMNAIGDGETLMNLDRKQLIEIENKICAAIANAANPAEAIIPKRTPHDDFSVWTKNVNRTAPVEVFTTNYDILFERGFEASSVPVFDAFVGTYHPFFYPECLEDDELLPRAKWIRLWKLHGSVTWRRGDPGIAGKRIYRSEPSTSGEMILPSQWKYDESRKQPYLAYMDRLSRILNLDHALLITCGYSFGDEHINAIIYGALDNRSTSNVVALQYPELSEGDELIKAAIQRPNLTVIGPNGGVISGIWGLWQLTQPVDNRTCAFMDSAFDSNAAPEDSGSPAATSPDLKGRMRLGDFNWFSRFLKEMGCEIK